MMHTFFQDTLFVLLFLNSFEFFFLCCFVSGTASVDLSTASHAGLPPLSPAGISSSVPLAMEGIQIPLTWLTVTRPQDYRLRKYLKFDLTFFFNDLQM